MELSGKPSTVRSIASLPNLRLLCSSKYDGTQGTPAIDTPTIFRSSKPDRLTPEDLPLFQNLGIKCIIDFRSKEEYSNSDCPKLLDSEYFLYKVTPAKKADQSFTTQRIGRASPTTTNELQTQQGLEKKHFLINFFTPSYILRSVSKMPCYLYCVGLFHFLCDLIRRDTSFKQFGRFFTQNVINRIGIKGQYRDITELCKPALCTALKLISDPGNSPMLVNCAHGKDRTGIVSALVLTCLGLPREHIIKDYALSQAGLEPIEHLVRQDIVDKYKLNEEFVTADAETMRYLLNHLENKYGSVSDYMVDIGFSLKEQMALRKRFSVPAPSLHEDTEDSLSELSGLRSRGSAID